jgi:Flp pilus assembly protein CpaB
MLLLRISARHFTSEIVFMHATALLFFAALCTSMPVHAGDEPRPLELVTVYVARTQIESRTVLKEPEKLFKAVRYVKGDEPRDAVTSLDQLKGTLLCRELAEDQPVKGKDLYRKKPGDGLSTSLPRGMRAYSVKVAWTGKEEDGYILPDSRVDVVYTRSDKKGKVERTVLFKNITVLGTDSLPVREHPPKYTTVTLAITPEQSQALALRGGDELYILVPRAPDDAKPAPSQKRSDSPVPASPKK